MPPSLVSPNAKRLGDTIRRMGRNVTPICKTKMMIFSELPCSGEQMTHPGDADDATAQTAGLSFLASVLTIFRHWKYSPGKETYCAYAPDHRNCSCHHGNICQSLRSRRRQLSGWPQPAAPGIQPLGKSTLCGHPFGRRSHQYLSVRRYRCPRRARPYLRPRWHPGAGHYPERRQCGLQRPLHRAAHQSHSLHHHPGWHLRTAVGQCRLQRRRSRYPAPLRRHRHRGRKHRSRPHPRRRPPVGAGLVLRHRNLRRERRHRCRFLCPGAGRATFDQLRLAPGPQPFCRFRLRHHRQRKRRGRPQFGLQRRGSLQHGHAPLSHLLRLPGGSPATPHRAAGDQRLPLPRRRRPGLCLHPRHHRRRTGQRQVRIHQ